VSPSNDPIRQWREEYARRMLQLDFEPVEGTVFRASTVGIVDGIRIVKSSFSPGFTIRDDELVKDSDDSYAFLISRSKHIIVDKKFQHFQLGHGDAALLRICEPGVVGAKTSFDYVAMMIPSAELQSRLSRTDIDLNKRLSKTSEGLQLLRSYVRALETGKRVMSINARAAIQHHLFDLAALAIENQLELGESTLSAIASARLAAAQEIIKSRFDQLEISIASVASALNVSPRYLQRLFHLSDTTFTAYVNGLRLDQAYTLLTDAKWDAIRISDIALRVGFSDISYFDRSFKHRFEASPSDIRAEASSKYTE
jgi:AraC-like DNA-binding protein